MSYIPLGIERLLFNWDFLKLDIPDIVKPSIRQFLISLDHRMQCRNSPLNEEMNYVAEKAHKKK